MSAERPDNLTTKDALNHAFPWPPLTAMPLPVRVVPSFGVTELRATLDGEIITRYHGDSVFKQVLADVANKTNEHLIRRCRPYLLREPIIGGMKGQKGREIWSSRLEDSIGLGLVRVVDTHNVMLAVSPIALARSLEHDDPTVLVVEPDWWREIDPPLLSVSDIVLVHALHTKAGEHYLKTDPNVQDSKLVSIDIGDWVIRHRVNPEHFLKRLQRLSQYGCLTINDSVLSVSVKEHQALTRLFDTTRGSGEKPIFVAKPDDDTSEPVEKRPNKATPSRPKAVDVQPKTPRQPAKVAVERISKPKKIDVTLDPQPARIRSRKERNKPRVLVDLLLKPRDIDAFTARPQGVIDVCGHQLDVSTRTYTSGEKVVQLTKKRASILAHLINRPNILYTPETLATLVYGVSTIQTRQCIKEHISKLRKQIELDPKNPQLIQSNGFQGYYFNAPELVDPNDLLIIGNISFNMQIGMINIGERIEGLSLTEGAIVKILMQSDVPISINELIEMLYVDSNDIARGAIRMHISEIRKKIEINPADPSIIIYIEGRGYFFNRS